MNVIILSESQNLYTTKRFIKELNHLSFTPLVINPYMASSHDIEKFNKNNTSMVINRISGVRMDDYDLKIVRKFELNKIRVFNPSTPSLMLRDKLSQYLFFKDYEYSLIPTYTCRGVGYLQLLERLNEGSFIIKPENGNQGRGITIVKNKHELLVALENFYKVKDQKYIIQPLIQNFREFRVLLSKKNIFVIIEKFNSDSPLRNLSNPGSTAKQIEPNSSLAKRLISLSKSILLNSNFDFLGIDFILIKEDNELYPLELNLCPGIKYAEELSGKNLAKEILNDFLAKALEV